MKMPGNDIVYHPAAVSSDIPALDASARLRIKGVIESKLGSAPETYGVPLRGTLKPYWKLRVGDYRVVFKIESSRVIILAIVHRKDIYAKTGRRIGRNG